ncbi:MAG TPA: hypothetical protein VGL53_04995 [Bryobacteraceae bacterium]|jgi:hypothetical protein
MDCVTSPIHEIQAASAFSSGMAASPVGRWYKSFSYVYASPKILRYLTKALTNDRLRAMSHKDVAEIYLPLVAIHRVFSRELARLESAHPLVSASILRWRFRRMHNDLERLGDVTEALAWSADDELRKTLDRAITKIEQTEFHLT